MFRILSIDGGGIRGIIPGQILVNVERWLREATRNEGTRLADYFDLFVGTSTGGILACAYVVPGRESEGGSPQRPRLSAKEVVGFYLEWGPEIFSIPLWHRLHSGVGVLDEKYPAGGLERGFIDLFGDVWLSGLLGDVLIPSYDIRRRRAHFFGSHDARRTAARDFLVRDVARATSAAPTFFELPKVLSRTQIPYPLIDGGVFANNPALCGYVEARSLQVRPLPRNVLLLSLGTGIVKRPYDYESAKDWGLARWIHPVIDIMMSALAETVDYELRKIFAANDVKHHYLRIAPELGDATSDLDDARTENMRALLAAGQEAAQQHKAELKAFVQALVASGPRTLPNTVPAAP